MREATIQKIAVAVGSLLLFSAAALLVFGVSHQTRVAQGHALVISPRVLAATTPTPSEPVTESAEATKPLTFGKQTTEAKSPSDTTRRETPEREIVTTAPRDSEDAESGSSKPENSKNEYDDENGATESNKAPGTGESRNRNQGESQEESQ